MPSSCSSSSSPSTSRSASSGRWPSPASLAVFHDVLISVGVYSLFGFEVTPATVVAFLTILGFSLYDTIVVFDKVHENAKRLGTRATYGDIVNLSMNQVLMRSLNTSAGRDPAGALAARRRVVDARRHHPAGLRARPAGRPDHRRLLVDLRRHADPGDPEGARAEVPGDPPAAGDSRRPGLRARRGWPPRTSCRWPWPPTPTPTIDVEGRRRRRPTAEPDTVAPRRAGCPPRLRPSPRRGLTHAPRPREEERAGNLARWWLDASWLAQHIRDVPDFPHPGVVFKDLTPLLGDADAFRFAVDAIADHFAGVAVDRVIGIEARGFILAAPVAYRMGASFVPDPQGRQAAVGGRPRGVRPRVRHRQAGDPPRRHPSRRAGPRRRRRAGHRRHGRRPRCSSSRGSAAWWSASGS